MKIKSIAVGASAVVCLFLVNHAIAQNGEAVPDPVEAYFDELISEGVLQTGVKALENAGQGVVHLKTVDSHTKTYKASRSIHFPFFLPVFGASQTLVPTLSSVVERLEKICVDGGGKLERGFVSVSSRDPAVQQHLSLVRRDRLHGDFTCKDEQGIQFLVNIFLPTAPGKNTLFPPGWEWSAHLHLLNTGFFQRFYDREGAKATENATFIDSLIPGQEAAINARHIPQSLRPQFPQSEARYLADNLYNVCALVVEVKGPLAQVQVGAGLIFVEKSKLRPFKRAERYGGSYSLDWDGWCFKP